jgi:hypothetical protein
VKGSIITSPGSGSKPLESKSIVFIPGAFLYKVEINSSLRHIFFIRSFILLEKKNLGHKMLPTTNPAKSAISRNDIESLNEDDRDVFDRASNYYNSQEDKMHLLAYLETCDFDEDIAHEKMEDIQEIKQNFNLNVENIIDFYGYEEDGVTPLPYMVCLEDGRGNCARAKDNSPIILNYGSPKGTSEEIIEQINFVIHRACKYLGPNEMPKITFVTNLIPRQTHHRIESHNMTVGKHMEKFPLTFRSYSCGVQEWMITASEKFKPLVPEKVQEKYKFSADYSILTDKIDPENMFPEWATNGTFDFDILKYKRWLLTQYKCTE